MNQTTKLKIAMLPQAVPLLAPLMVYSKPVGEAVSVVTDSETMDPNGVKLMVGCIALLVFLAFTLIGVTIWYFAKAKKKESGQEGTID